MPGTGSISIRGVSKSFGETRALTECNFDAYPGEVHAVVGENGSGKSTLAKILSGVLSPDTGTAEVLGEQVTTPRQARAVGIATIFQEVLVAEEASVLDNLFVGSEGMLSNGLSRKEKLASAQEILTRCIGSPIDLDAPAGSYPLSVRQWIVIARAVLRQPKVLILDESSAALDLDSTNRLFGEIERLRDAGCTVLIVTHRIAELVRIADRATILRDGRAVGTLGRADITEEKLLQLMTQSGRQVSDAPTRRTSDAVPVTEPILSARAVRLSAQADPFDWELRPGMIVGLAGLDGQGQELFAQSLAGLTQLPSGAVACRSVSGASMPIASLSDASDAHISWVSGDRKREGIFPQRSIFENFAMGIYRRRLGPFGTVDLGRAHALFDNEVDRLKIKTGPITNRITSLSGGNQQKVLISRAFADDPRIIILNDPARGVDIATKRDLYRELIAFAASGGAVVYLSSEIEEFPGFANRVDVYFKSTLFRSLSGDEIEEDTMLAAMFGQVPVPEANSAMLEALQ